MARQRAGLDAKQITDRANLRGIQRAPGAAGYTQPNDDPRENIYKGFGPSYTNRLSERLTLKAGDKHKGPLAPFFGEREGDEARKIGLGAGTLTDKLQRRLGKINYLADYDKDAGQFVKAGLGSEISDMLKAVSEGKQLTKGEQLRAGEILADKAIADKFSLKKSEVENAKYGLEGDYRNAFMNNPDQFLLYQKALTEGNKVQADVLRGEINTGQADTSKLTDMLKNANTPESKALTAKFFETYRASSKLTDDQYRKLMKSVPAYSAKPEETAADQIQASTGLDKLVRGMFPSLGKIIDFFGGPSHTSRMIVHSFLSTLKGVLG
jgi:hypothetical protein